MSTKSNENVVRVHHSRRGLIDYGEKSGTEMRKQSRAKNVDSSAGKMRDESRRKKNAVNRMKKRIRDLRRLLEHSQNLPADIRVVQERELATLQQDCEVATAEIQRSDIIGKYHMVRFFERKKAMRFLKQAQRRVEQDAAKDNPSLTQELHALEVDLKYTTHCPLDLKYSSLYSKHNVGGEEKYVPNRDRPMWKLVEAAMEQGTLEELRNGERKQNWNESETNEQLSTRDPQNGLGTMESKKKSQRSRSAKPTQISHIENRNAAAANSSSDEEDGEGFFER